MGVHADASRLPGTLRFLFVTIGWRFVNRQSLGEKRNLTPPKLSALGSAHRANLDANQSRQHPEDSQPKSRFNDPRLSRG